MDRMDAKWTKKDDKWTEIRLSKGSNRKTQPEALPHVFGSKRNSGTPDKIRTCDLLLRRQTATTCYLQLRLGKWTLSGQNLWWFQESKGSIGVNLTRRGALLWV